MECLKEDMEVWLHRCQVPKLTFERDRQREDHVLGFSRPWKNLVVPISHPQKENEDYIVHCIQPRFNCSLLKKPILVTLANVT